jgi:cytidyltransferase-like protein
MTTVIASGSFDDLRARHVRFLEEASQLGDLRVLLYSDAVVRHLTGQQPRFPQAERQYLLEAIRFVSQVSLVTELASSDELPLFADAAPQLGPGRTREAEALRRAPGNAPPIWAVDEVDDSEARRAFCALHGLEYRVFTRAGLAGFPAAPVTEAGAVGHPSVFVTGCYDWLHSGHVRFFEEASSYGDLIVAAGNDANVRHLKGKGHPLQTQEERRYMVAAIRYVKLALITSGWGWMDAEPEIARFRPDIYLVNEDGDKPEKRRFCEAHGLRYVVLKRTPREGLPPRSSTDLRGF